MYYFKALLIAMAAWPTAFGLQSGAQEPEHIRNRRELSDLARVLRIEFDKSQTCSLEFRSLWSAMTELLSNKEFLVLETGPSYGLVSETGLTHLSKNIVPACQEFDDKYLKQMQGRLGRSVVSALSEDRNIYNKTKELIDFVVRGGDVTSEKLFLGVVHRFLALVDAIYHFAR